MLDPSKFLYQHAGDITRCQDTLQDIAVALTRHAGVLLEAPPKSSGLAHVFPPTIHIAATLVPPRHVNLKPAVPTTVASEPKTPASLPSPGPTIATPILTTSVSVKPPFVELKKVPDNTAPTIAITTPVAPVLKLVEKLKIIQAMGSPSRPSSPIDMVIPEVEPKPATATVEKPTVIPEATITTLEKAAAIIGASITTLDKATAIMEPVVISPNKLEVATTKSSVETPVVSAVVPTITKVEEVAATSQPSDLSSSVYSPPSCDSSTETYDTEEEIKKPASKKRIVKKKKTSKRVIKEEKEEGEVTGDDEEYTEITGPSPKRDIKKRKSAPAPIKIPEAAPARSSAPEAIPPNSPLTRRARRIVGNDLGINSMESILKGLEENRVKLVEWIRSNNGAFPTTQQVFPILNLFTKFPKGFTLERGHYDCNPPSRSTLSLSTTPGKFFDLPYVHVASYLELYTNDWKDNGYETFLATDPTDLDLIIPGYLYTYHSNKTYTLMVPTSLRSTVCEAKEFRLVKKCWRLDLTGQKDLQRLTLTIILPQFVNTLIWNTIMTLNPSDKKKDGHNLKAITRAEFEKY